MKYQSSLLIRIPEPEVLGANEDQLYSSLGFNFEKTIQELQRLIHDTQKMIVDVGCAGGDLVAEIKKTFPNKTVKGIDPSEEMIRIAKNKHRIIQDLFHIGYFTKETPCDFLVCESVLHHISNPQEQLFEVLACHQNKNTKFSFYIKDLRRPMNEKKLKELLKNFPSQYPSMAKTMYEASLRAAYSAKEVMEMLEKSGVKANVYNDEKYLYIQS